MKGEPTPALKTAGKRLAPSLNAEGQAFQVGLSTIMLCLEGNCGSDSDR